MFDSAPRPSPFVSAAALRARQAQWDHFHDWEMKHPRVFPDLKTAWRWYEEMYDLGRRTGAIPAVPQLDEEKIRRIQMTQSRLARLRWPS
jgi:hypothetical protein